jgi:hypothetical protein
VVASAVGIGRRGGPRSAGPPVRGPRLAAPSPAPARSAPRGRLIRANPGRKACCVSALVDGARGFGRRGIGRRGGPRSAGPPVRGPRLAAPARGPIPGTRRPGRPHARHRGRGAGPGGGFGGRHRAGGVCVRAREVGERGDVGGIQLFLPRAVMAGRPRSSPASAAPVGSAGRADRPRGRVQQASGGRRTG